MQSSQVCALPEPNGSVINLSSTNVAHGGCGLNKKYHLLVQTVGFVVAAESTFTRRVASTPHILEF